MFFDHAFTKNQNFKDSYFNNILILTKLFQILQNKIGYLYEKMIYISVNA